MISTHQKFIRLLQIEIECLHDEIEILLRSLDQRLADHEITDYVRNENGAVLRNELLALDDFLRNLSETELEEQPLDEIVSQVKAHMRTRLLERGYVPAVYELVSRRIDRVVDYLRTPASL